MRHLTLANLILGLDNLLDVKTALLASTQMGQSYKPVLEHKRSQLAALPESLKGKEPLTAEIAATDDVHDDSGASLWYMSEAIRLSPLSTPEQKAAAERMQKALVPERNVLRAPHADEASAAKKNREKLSGLEADLKSIPYPGGKTAYDVALNYVEAGERLDTLLQDRANIKANTALNEQARALRQATLKTLNNLRSALRDEIEENQALPRNLEEQLFAYFDELEGRREDKAPAGKAGGDAGPGGPA